MARGRAAWPWLLLVVAAAILPYAPSLSGSFGLDDWELIVRDPLAHGIGNWRAAFFTDFLRGSLGKDLIYYRPLVTISFQANYTAFGPNPLAFRLTNIGLHLIVSLLVFALALRLTKSSFAAGVAGAAFGVLPSHAESVAWISGRTDVMSVLFMLASLLAFIAARGRERFSWPLAATSSLAFLCALLSKEQALVLPVLMAAYVWTSCKPMSRAELLKWAVVLVAPLIGFLVVRNQAVGVVVDQHLTLALGRRLLGVGIAYGSYLRMLLLPRELQVVYDVFPIGMRYPVLALAAWLIPIGLGAAGVLLRRRLPVAAFCSLWVLISLLPVSNILPTSGPLPAERFVYLASAGSSVFLGWLAWKAFLARPRSMRLWPAVVVVVIGWYLLYCSALAIHGGRAYVSDVEWARRVAASNTRFAMFHGAAAQYLADASLLEEAAKEFEAALNVNDPTFTDRHRANVNYQLGLVYVESGDLEGAAGAFRSAAELDPGFWQAWRNLARVCMEMGRYEEAVSAYVTAFAIESPDEKGRSELERAREALDEAR